MLKRLVLVALVILMGVFIWKNLPKSTIQEATQTEFVTETSFKDIQRAMRKGNFEQETLRINGAELVSKQWLDKHFNIQRPLRKDRHWEFSGRLLAKVRVDNQHAGKMEVELVEDIFFATDRIEVKTRLAKPLGIGVSDIYQEICIVPEGEKARVKLSSQITLKRFVPFFMKDYATKEVKGATVDSVSRMETVIRNLKR